MKLNLLFALLLVAGCAHGTTDDPDTSEPAMLQIEAWDANDGDRLLTATDHAAFDIRGEASLPETGILAEAAACNTIVGSYHARGLEIGCATTTHVCPDLLRFAYGQSCLQYEAATVDDCRQRIVNADTCEELWATSCDVLAVPGSAPLGCPADEPL